MKALAVICLILGFTAGAFAQTRRGNRSSVATVKTNPEITIQTATTRDGRTVLLKSDGTWQYSSDPTPPVSRSNVGAASALRL
jgi:hypothetical protein